VDLTIEEEDDNMDDSPASPSPNVSDGDDSMNFDEEEDLLVYHGLNRDTSSDEDGFQHVCSRPTRHQHQRPQGSKLLNVIIMAGPVDRCIRTASNEQFFFVQFLIMLYRQIYIVI